jgi:transcriptional regulator with XRE-family HTH domain
MMAAREIIEPGTLLPIGELSEMQQLSNAKQCALIELAKGLSISRTAQRIGRSRATIYNWLRNDPRFTAAFNAWKSELSISARARLSVLYDKAIDSLDESLSNPDGKMAMKLLVGMGVIAPQQPDCEDAEEIALKHELDRMQRKAELRKAIKALELAEAAQSPAADAQPISQREPANVPNAETNEAKSVLAA